MDEIKTVPFITDIPESTIALEINAKLYIDGEIKTARTVINDAGQIREQMELGLDYEWEHCEFTLTEEYEKEQKHG